MPFWTPWKNGPTSQLKCPESAFLDVLIQKDGLSGHLNCLLGRFFWEVHFSDFKIGNAGLFTKILFTIFVPLDPPPSQPAK